MSELGKILSEVIQALKCVCSLSYEDSAFNSLL